MITYTDKIEGIRAEELSGFFEDWKKVPPPEVHLKALQNSEEVVLAIDDETGRIVGFISALTDGVMTAYIALLEVLPEYRSQGVGSELVRRMLEKLKHMYMVDLLCDEDTQGFYERLGMRKTTGMMLRNMHE